MKRHEISDLTTFLVVAEQGNFTRAAVELGVSQSAISHAIRRLEASLGFRLLNRSTRSVTVTDLGDKLLASLKPGLGQISARIEELRSFKDTPRGLVRITATRDMALGRLWSVITGLIHDYPEVQVEVNTNSRVVDLAEGGFDAAIRLAENVGPDLIAVPVSPDLEMAAVASPAYLATHGEPLVPSDLAAHQCITMRFAADTLPYDWEFEQNGQQVVRRVQGPMIFNDGELCVAAAREGFGIAYVLLTEVQSDLDSGRLRRVLADWCPPFEGYRLCYSSRRQMTSALKLLIERMRIRA